jgi:hypothetical protein
MNELASRVLDFPVRAAAVDDFRRQLRARNFADLSAVAAALGDAALFDQLLGHWIERGWISRSPSSPIYAFGGSNFSPDVTLAEFCGETIEYDRQTPEGSDDTPPD